MTHDDALAAPAADDPEGWTDARVAQALVKAFVTLDRLPRVKGPREPGGSWPQAKREWADELAAAELDEAERKAREETARRALSRPTGADIARMDAALEWLRELRAADAGMALVTTLWALRAARGRSVKALMKEKSWAPHTFYRKRAKALAFIAQALNMRGAPVF